MSLAGLGACLDLVELGPGRGLGGARLDVGSGGAWGLADPGAWRGLGPGLSLRPGCTWSLVGFGPGPAAWLLEGSGC